MMVLVLFTEKIVTKFKFITSMLKFEKGFLMKKLWRSIKLRLGFTVYETGKIGSFIYYDETSRMNKRKWKKLKRWTK